MRREQVNFTVNDYAPRVQAAEELAKDLQEQVSALEAQIAAMRGDGATSTAAAELRCRHVIAGPEDSKRPERFGA